MPDEKPLDNAIKAPEPAPEPATPPPAPEEIKLDDISTEEYDRLLSEGKITEDGRPTPPAKAEDEKPAAAPPVEPAKATDAQPAAPQPSQATPAADQVAEMWAELEALKQGTEQFRNFQADPVGFLRNNPEQLQMIRQAVQSLDGEQARQQRPDWAYAPVESLIVPRDPLQWGNYAGHRLADLKAEAQAGRMPQEHYDQIVRALTFMQGDARGRWETEQGVGRRAQEQQAAKDWEDFGEELRKDDPSITAEAIQQTNRALTDFLAKTRLTPALAYRLMNLDRLISEAKAQGVKEGREGVLSEMKKAGSAPGSASAAPGGEAQAGTLLDQYKAVMDNDTALAAFYGDLSAKQMKQLIKDAEAAGVVLV